MLQGYNCKVGLSAPQKSRSGSRVCWCVLGLALALDNAIYRSGSLHKAAQRIQKYFL